MVDLLRRDVSKDERAQSGPRSTESLFSLRNEPKIGEFLMEQPHLRPLLEEAYHRIESYFPGSELILEVVSDPEDSQDRQLALFIATNLGPHEAMANLERLDQEWWLDSLPRGRGRLCITLEFR